MKKAIFFIIAVLGIICFPGCEKDKVGPYLDATPDGPVISSTVAGGSFILLEDNEEDIFGHFVWTAAEYGFQSAPTYFLQIDFAGNNFAAPKDMSNTNGRSASFTVSDLNNALLSLEADPDVAVDLEARIMAVLHTEIDTLYSNVLAFNVTPFEKIIIYPRLFMPGDHNGWNAADSASVIWSAKFNDKYEGYIYIPDNSGNPSGFKLLKVPAWEEDNTIGDPDASGTTGTLQVGSWGGNNIMVSTVGLHRIQADLVALTYSVTPMAWGIIGGSVPPYDWSADVDMVYNIVDNVLEVTLDLVAGDFKFRANDGWATNYGDNEGDGIVDSDGSNIPIAADGNYTITLDLSQALYTYTVVKN